MKAPNWIKCASETIAGGCLLLSLINCNGEITTTDNLKTLETEFADPSAEYRTAPLSVWNNKMTEQIDYDPNTVLEALNNKADRDLNNVTDGTYQVLTTKNGSSYKKRRIL